jgi:hypothetical protein
MIYDSKRDVYKLSAHCPPFDTVIVISSHNGEAQADVMMKSSAGGKKKK